MPEDIEIRPIRADEYEAVGAATASAYPEFWQPNPPGWDEYLAFIADVGSRAERATVLVALDAGAIAGSATLELDARIRPGPAEPLPPGPAPPRGGPPPAEPLPPGHAHLRMVGVSPEHRGKGIGRLLVVASIDLARARG